MEIAVANGLDSQAAREVLENRTYKEKLEEHWDRSVQYNITAVPSYVISTQVAHGDKSYEELTRLMQSAGAKPRGE